jgi:DNA-directed RNA polymerase specialized sigma24 family protein
MEQRKSQLREPAEAAQVNQLLAGHYNQLLKWGVVLTRGDAGKTEEIVQELCLYFTLTKPDLSNVANLNGYLYTCLRHIYLSTLARSSREALHVVSTAGYDSFEFALDPNRSGDPLERQNDLRRICGYVAWRKKTSKSASCFILHFFHGYGRREIAELACLPIAAIYNNLKIARAEVKSYLEEPGKIRVLNRELPPEPTLAWSLSSSGEVFTELRKTILHARSSECISEEELLAHYRSPEPRPISCSLLDHMVSCERCLAVVDRHFRRPTLECREPLDGFGSSSDSSGSVVGPSAVDQVMLRSVHKRWAKFHEHRPRTLSIAVNGQIIAFHDVQARHSKLSARIEYPERARFIEVFSEQDVRLALLPIGELPPEGPYTLAQRVALSDARWVELNLTFDGLGLNSEVAYFDPVLVIEGTEEGTEESPMAWESKREMPIRASGVLHWLRSCARIFRLATPSSAIAWALTLAIILGTTGYFAYRHQRAPLDAGEILNESIKIEAADLQGQTEHQVLRIEEVSANGQILQQGIVDLWRDGDGNRYLRRLFDSSHRVIAAKWRNKNVEHSSRRREGGKDASIGDSLVLMDGFWGQDLSARGFSLLAGNASQVRAVEGGYELTVSGPTVDRPHLISATLVLDHHLLPVREVMHVRNGPEIRELRFVQAEYERKPSASVPDTVFDPADGHPRSSEGQGLLHQHSFPNATVPDVQLAELQIAVLYQLNALDADTGAPIEVTKTMDGHIRVSGTVVNDALKQKIAARMKTLANHQLLDLRLLTPLDVRTPAPSAPRALSADASVYDVRQPRFAADATVRRYFEAKGLSGERLDSAVAQFSLDALQHAQRALQNAYALERLGSTLSAAELQSISLSSQRQWTEMVYNHASELESQLRALHAQLALILPPREDMPNAGGGSLQVESPEQFNRAVNELLRQIQDLNRDVGESFASSATEGSPPGQDDPLESAMNAMPLRRADEIISFAKQLNSSARAATVNRQNSQDGQNIPDQLR